MKRQVRSSRRRSTHLLALSAWRVRLVFWSGAVIVGLVSALFALGAQWAEHLFAQGASRWPWMPLVLTPLGLGLIAWITVRFVPQSKGSGIPQAIAALKAHTSDEMRDSVLSLRVAAAKIALTILGLACGASIGREGPTVHVGAAVMHSLGRLAHFPAHYMERGLIMAGGAAGVAAAFNTPLAGVMFAIEEMGRSYDKRTGSVVLVAVMLAGITAMLVMGNYHYFGSTSASIDNVLSIWYVIVTCGVAGGVLGGLFSTALIHGGRVMAPAYIRHPVLIAMACGLAVAVIGVVSGAGIYGTGYHEAKAILDGGGDGHDLLYPLWKLLATIMSYLSGIPGGIFAPSLSTGAGFGAGMAEAFPHVAFGSVVLLGMVGYFSGVVQTPITAFIIVMEMTDNQDMILPLMATSLIAAGASRFVCPRPIYGAMADTFLATLRQGRKPDGGVDPADHHDAPPPRR